MTLLFRQARQRVRLRRPTQGPRVRLRRRGRVQRAVEGHDEEGRRRPRVGQEGMHTGGKSMKNKINKYSSTFAWG
jgi:hypothetical protein